MGKAGERRKKREEELKAYEGVRVADMNVPGMPDYRESATEELAEGGRISDTELTRGERRAMIKGAFAAMFPAFLTGLGIFTAAFVIVKLILRAMMG